MNEDVLKNILKGMDDMSKRIRNLEAVELLMPGTTVLTATQSIGDSAWATVSFDSGVVGHGFSWEIGDPTNIYFTSARNTQRAILVGRAQFDPANCYAGIRVTLTRPGGTDTYILGQYYYGAFGPSTQNLVLGWAYPIVFDSSDMYSSFIVQAYQDSGGALDLDPITFGMFYIR